MFRVHTAGSVGGTTAIVAASHVQAGKHKHGAGRRLREAVRGQRPVRPGQRQGRLAGRRRCVRPVHPRLHPPQRGPRAHRLEGGGQGPAERAEESLRPPARSRTSPSRRCKASPDDVGADPLPRVVPVLRRRLRRGHHRRGGGKAAAADGGLRPGSSAPRPAPSRRASPVAIRCDPRPPAVRSRRLRARPGSPIPAARSTRPSSTCRSRGTSPSGSRPFGLAEEGEGWKMIDDGDTEIGGSFPVNCLRRRALEQPHRRLGSAPLRRSGQPGAGRRRRAPGRWGQDGPRHGLRRQLQYFSTWAVGSSLHPFG